MKRCLLVITLLLFSSFVYADSLTTPFYKGDVQIKLNQETYKPGHIIEAEITIFNGEPYPISDGFLVIELVKGRAEPIYPSQMSDEDIIFYEEIQKDLTLTPGASKKINFQFPITSELKGGSYRLDVFFRTKKTPIIGMAHILLPGKSKHFQIINGGHFPNSNILRTKTWILNEQSTGPIGPLVDSDEDTISGSVFFENINEDLILELKVCGWDDITCDKSELEQIYHIPKGSTSVNFNFDAPNDPDAYAVRLELKKGDKLFSLYRSRFITTGDVVKIRKLSVDKLYLEKGEEVNLKVTLFGSPDHYTYPVVKDAKLKVFVKDLESDGTIFEKTESLPDMDSASDSLTIRNFGFESPVKSNKFMVCAETHSQNNKLLDDYCYVVDVSKFILIDYNITADFEYNAEYKELLLEICALHNSGAQIKTQTQYELSLGNNPVKISELEVEGCSKQTIAGMEKNNYGLLVYDKNQKRQYSFVIDLTNLEEMDDEEENPPQNYLVYAVVLAVIILILGIMMLLLRRKKEEKYYD